MCEERGTALILTVIVTFVATLSTGYVGYLFGYEHGYSMGKSIASTPRDIGYVIGCRRPTDRLTWTTR